MSSDVLPRTETDKPPAGQPSAIHPSEQRVRSGNLYVELPGDRWDWARRQLRNSCDGLVRRYPSLADAARAESKSVEQFLMDAMFADLLPAHLALAKLTFPSGSRSVNINVSIRLSGDARPNWPLPKGISLVAKASWNLSGTDRETQRSYGNRNPTLTVFSFHDGPAGEARDFEVALDVTCRQVARMVAGVRKERIVLTEDLAAALPAISSETAVRLQDWSAFLEWKRRLIQANRTAVRYESRHAGEDHRSVTFRLIGDNEEALSQAIRRLSQSDALAAFDVSVSEDEWQFQLPSEGREPRGSELGSARRVRPRITAADSAVLDAPWDSAVTTDFTFAFSDDALARIERSDDPEAAARKALDRIPEAGFIVQSAVQDMSQVNRQDRALRDLSDQGGFSPYLARYMFDAAEARQPASLADVERWHNQTLNDAQKLAVQKVLSAPDLCLIQGPPGTGKTTVIAEAIAQVVARDETVLVASQTHTAVDNALSRLPLHPSIRAVRLTRNEDRLSDEGQEFLNEKSLGRYYRALSAEIQQRRDDAAHEQQFAAQLTSFRAKSTQLLESLTAAEASHSAAVEGYDALVVTYADQVRALGATGVPVPSLGEAALDRLQLEELDQWLGRLRTAVPVAREYARSVVEDKPGPSATPKSERRRELEAQLADVLEKMKVDSAAVEDYQRLQAELEGLTSDTSTNAPDVRTLARFFPGATSVFDEPPKGLLARFKRSARMSAARDLLESTSSLAASIPPIDESRTAREQAHSASVDAQRRRELALSEAESLLTSPVAQSLGIVVDKLPRTATALDQARQEGESRLSGKIERATRLSAESEAWGDIQDEWIADLSDETVASRDWEAIGDVWLAECNVVGVTCNENPATLDDPGLTSFDLAVVDEVSKATPLELLLPLMRARRSALVGDHRQLPPMFREGQDAEGLPEDADDDVPAEVALTPDNLKKYEKFVTASLFRTHFERADESIKQRLTVQHRMHPDIMDSVNRFYEGQLTSGIADPNAARAHGLTIRGRGDLPVISPEQHMVWIDTTNDDRGAAWSEPRQGSGQERTNILEARLIVRMLRDIDDALLSGSSRSGSPKEIGIVSMYQAQVRTIRQEIHRATKDRPFKAIKYELNTVVKYQGKEKPIILVSMVRNFGRGAPARRRSSRANVARFEYINVAFSRAQELLVVFGALDTFAPYPVELPPMDANGTPSVIPVYREITEMVERKGAMKQASALGDLPAASGQGLRA